MRCAKCGFSNIHGAKFCSECGSPMEMPIAGKQEKQNPNRKVIKLPSDVGHEEKTPIERPWEVRVPKRESGSSAQDGAAGAAGASASSNKGPTPRRRTGSTGRIPAIKHPANESGKISVEERASTAAARTGAASKPSPGDTAPILIDDLATPSAAGAGAGASASPTPRPRRNARYDAAATASNGRGDRRRFVAIIVAVLVVCCIVAFGIFFSNPANNTKTVSFDTDGGTVIGNQYILDNGKLERPANPTRPGYVFDGWYYDANYNDEVSFPVDVTQDLKLYAKWKEESTMNALPSSPSTNTPEATTPGNDSATTGGSTGSGNTSGSTSGSGSGSASGAGSSGATVPGGSSGSSGGSSSGGSAGGGSSSGSNLNGPGVSNGNVNISLVAANGRALTGTVNLHDGYVIPNSSEKAYTIDELRALGLNDAELCIARNEPYARQGYSFRNPGLQAYFNARSWYHNKGWRGELPQDSAGYITAHNLLTIAEQSPSAAQWLRLRTR